jgi:hypothetical protein
MDGSSAVTSWVPSTCTLPTVDQPLRVADFDDLFTTAVLSVERVAHLHLRLNLIAEASVAARVATLVVQETDCCSFFQFNLIATGGRLTLEVAVPPEHVDVLDAIANRASAGARP